jgi:hypothetical protein
MRRGDPHKLGELLSVVLWDPADLLTRGRLIFRCFNDPLAMGWDAFNKMANALLAGLVGLKNAFFLTFLPKNKTGSPLNSLSVVERY